ncbi:MAG TPA: GNAT family protein [Herpetosiphonaceae bacterium]
MEQPALATERLVLRPFALSDAPAVKALAGAPEVARTTLNVPHPYPDGAAEDWIGRHAGFFASRQAVVYAVTLRADGALCGSISLGIARQHERAEMGYWFGMAFWGRGYATEAARALCDFGFRSLGLNRIYAQHFAANPASGRVMQKVGMAYEGTLRQHHRKDGEYVDSLCYAILREQWLAGAAAG